MVRRPLFLMGIVIAGKGVAQRVDLSTHVLDVGWRNETSVLLRFQARTPFVSVMTLTLPTDRQTALKTLRGISRCPAFLPSLGLGSPVLAPWGRRSWSAKTQRPRHPVRLVVDAPMQRKQRRRFCTRTMHSR